MTTICSMALRKYSLIKLFQNTRLPTFFIPSHSIHLSIFTRNDKHFIKRNIMLGLGSSPCQLHKKHPRNEKHSCSIVNMIIITIIEQQNYSPTLNLSAIQNDYPDVSKVSSYWHSNVFCKKFLWEVHGFYFLSDEYLRKWRKRRTETEEQTTLTVMWNPFL